MKEIPLSKGKCALVDDMDYDRVARYKWTALESHGHCYGYRKVRDGDKERTQLLHRFIAGLGFGDKRQVDHINRNGLDNRRKNLRVCTHGENLMNGKSKGGSSCFKGVTYFPRCDSWVAQITHNNNHRKLGYFKKETDAAKAYDKEAVKYFGNYALTNEAMGLYESC